MNLTKLRGWVGQLCNCSEKSPVKTNTIAASSYFVNTVGKHRSYNWWLTNSTVSCLLRITSINSQIFQIKHQQRKAIPQVPPALQSPHLLQVRQPVVFLLPKKPREGIIRYKTTSQIRPETFQRLKEVQETFRVNKN